MPHLGRRQAAVGAVLVAAVLVRLHSPSPLWLDEALSVNIATLPLGELQAALRQDGAPPLYYLLLHGWTEVLGAGDVAVRALSVLFALGALPLLWLAGTRLGGPATGTAAVLLLASNPFAVRYATETRMYSLVVLLVAAGVLVLLDALRDPRPRRLLPVALVAGALALTHYWTLFLLAVVGAGLAVHAVRGRREAGRALLALVAGGLLFLPWLPTFLFQVAHTGTPWARPPGLGRVVSTWTGWAGEGWSAEVLGLLLLALAAAAVLARPWTGPDSAPGVLLRLPASRPGLLVTGTAFATLLLGIGVAAAGSSGYALRYSAVALPVALLAAALGVTALPEPARSRVLGTAVALGLLGAFPLTLDTTRTQAERTAAVLSPRLFPGDAVVYCPDQLGPAVERLLPAGTAQLTYPSGEGPQRIDWVDYAQRNAAADPDAFAARLSAGTEGAVWLVRGDGYRTFGEDCRELDAALAGLRGDREVALGRQRGYDERAELVRFP